MKRNMGSLDRIVRIIGALALLIISMLNPVEGLASTITMVFIALLVLTAATGFCPFYALMKRNTLNR